MINIKAKPENPEFDGLCLCPFKHIISAFHSLVVLLDFYQINDSLNYC